MNLEFLRQVAEHHGHDDLYLVNFATSCVKSLEAADLTELANAYREIEVRGMARTLVDYVDEQDDTDPLAHKVYMLLRLFSYLCQFEIQPFAMGSVKCFVGPEIDGWDEVPPSLQFLVPYAEKYGEFYGEVDIYEFLDDCTPQMKAEIIQVMKMCYGPYNNDGGFKSAFDSFIAPPNLRRLRAANKFFCLWELLYFAGAYGLYDEVKE